MAADSARGATALTDAVRATLGPRAKCVLNRATMGKPLVSNDGVTIAKELTLVDPDENLGAQLLREAGTLLLAEATLTEVREEEEEHRRRDLEPALEDDRSVAARCPAFPHAGKCPV